MTDPELRQQCENLAACRGGDFAIEGIAIAGCYPAVMSDDGGYLAIITVRSTDLDESLHPWTACGRGKTPDDAMRDLLAHHAT